MSALSAILFKNRRHATNSFRVIRNQSTFKVLFILAFALSFEVGLYLLFLDSFRFLDAFGGAGMLLIGRLFSLFFMGLGSMVLVSSIVTAYSTLFGSDEIPFLMVRPFSVSHIVLYKFVEATGFASWAFFFVVVPFVTAYAWHEKLTPLFAIWTLLFSLPFLFLFSGIGTLVVILLVRWCPRGRIIKLVGLAAAVIATVVVWNIGDNSFDAMQSQQFNIAKLIPGLRISSYPLNPCWWVAEGIMSLTRGAWIRGGLFFVSLLSTSLLISMFIEWIGQHIFFDAWHRVLAGGRVKRKPVLLPHLDHLRAILPDDVAAIIKKDIRTFFRDAVQWSQALVFFGLLGLYFANLRNFNYNVLPDQWRSAISFLNIFAVSAVLSSLGSRFVFPQLSLEGHGFWLLGLSPVNKARILLAKFLLAMISLSSISVALVLLSSSMLSTAPMIRVIGTAIICCIAITVCAVSTGLGAIFLDLHQRNPAAIVSGFGGTLNLVLCLTFMLITILPFGILFHLQSTAKILPAHFSAGLKIGTFWLLGSTMLFTAIPLALGFKAMENRDY